MLKGPAGVCTAPLRADAAISPAPASDVFKSLNRACPEWDFSSLVRWCAAQVARRTPRRIVVQCSANASDTKTTPVKVTFRIPYRVQFGQSVGVVGAGDLLGAWEGTKAVRMKWAPGDFWEAEISVLPGSATQLEYKYVVLNANGMVSHWKPGQNYKLDVLAARGTRVLVVETWDDGPRHVEVDMQGSEVKSTVQETGSTASKNGSSQPEVKAPPPSEASIPDKATAKNGSNGSKPQESLNPERNASPRAASPTPRRSTTPSMESATTVIQQEAQVAMSELKDALQRSVATMARVQDPTSIEVIMGDRLLAAANSKAVALNRAVRAAEALPMLPPGTDVTLTQDKSQVNS